VRIASCVAFVTAVACSALPTLAAAQTGARPMARAAEREAVRLASQPPSSPPARRESRDLSDWAPVARINAGDEIVLTTTRLSHVKRRLLSADSASLTVLKVDDTAIPDQVREALEDAGEDHPAYFAQATAGGRFALNKHVRLGPDGVFEDDRRLFDIAHVTEVVPRDDVVEVGVMGKHVWRHSKRGLLIGAGAGAVFGALTAVGCDPNGEADYCNVGGMAALYAIGGSAVGLEVGTIVGAIAPRSPDVIYRR